ncbi:ubiquitin carboxyl-terminal hydrolase 12-like protein [Trifolium pratense]|uniref:ubiquitinyl hydrolase 1 n=2 Tax=Trifolium TaxID=3898 RepID=A0A2K3NL81_TRIPR|nr:ubiquitin carboxyl-terminal hydrolase 12-like protein [Trifolium pratense]
MLPPKIPHNITLPNGSKAQVTDRSTGKTIGTGFESHALYYLNPHSSSVCGVSPSPDIIHCRLGHPSLDKSKLLVPQLSHLKTLDCESCLLGKHVQVSFPSSANKRSMSSFDTVHSDIWGPSQVPSNLGYRYYVTFIDDFSRYTWMTLLKNCSELFSAFQTFYSEIKTQFGKTIRILRSDNAKEYFSKQFNSFLASQGIIHQCSCPHTPQQNGVADWKHRHIVDTSRTLLINAHAPSKFWADAILTSCYLINRMPSSVLNNEIPHSLLFPRDSLYPLPLRVFDSTCFVLDLSPGRDKLSARAQKGHQCVFLGCSRVQKGYQCYCPSTHRFYADVTFFEDMPFFARLDTSESTLQEIKFEPNVMCEPIDKKVTFRASQLVMVEWLISCNWRLWQVAVAACGNDVLEDGDIVCFQKAPAVDNEEQVRYPDVPSYLEYVHNRQVVHFRSLDRPKEDDFSLEMSRLHTYDDVVERVAQQLDLDDPSKIRLTPHNCYSQQPKPQPIKYRGVDHLSDMLVHYNQTSDILYYEVLDIPLPELQGLKTLKVAFHSAIKDEVVSHTIRLPKQSSVGDVLDDLKTKVELSLPDAELRLLEVFYHKIYKVFPSNEKIENINDQYWTLRAEEIPEEEKNIGPQDRLIHVYHFTKDTAQNQMQIQNFGDPFFLVIHEGEALSEIKVRIQKKLQVPDEEFSKWKFAFLSLGRPEYLQDSDIVSSRFQRRDVYGAWEQYLGLEHTDNAPKRSYAANQVGKFSV